MNKFECVGEIVKKSKLEKLTSKKGNPYIKASVVIEMEGVQFNSELSLNIIKEDVYNYCELGQKVKAYFNLSSNEWENRYFTNATCWRIEKDGEGNQTPAEKAVSDFKADEPELTKSDEPEADLPF